MDDALKQSILLALDSVIAGQEKILSIQMDIDYREHVMYIKTNTGNAFKITLMHIVQQEVEKLEEGLFTIESTLSYALIESELITGQEYIVTRKIDYANDTLYIKTNTGKAFKLTKE